MKTVALITPIEQNKSVKTVDQTVKFRYFEEELIRMVKSWRTHGGIFKNIPIYVFNLNKCSPKDSIIDELRKLNCVYTENYHVDVQNFEYGFLNEPLCGLVAEKNLNEDFFIKIDLDMQLLKPLSDDLFGVTEKTTVVGRYSASDSKEQRVGYDNFIPFDTNFIISHKKSHFYEKYYESCFNSDMLNSEEYKRVVAHDGGNYHQEEFAVDFMFKNGICNIKPIINYNFGEGYRDLSEMTDEEVDNINFLHGHIYMDNKIFDEKNEKIKYFKRICQIKTKNRRF